MRRLHSIQTRVGKALRCCIALCLVVGLAPMVAHAETVLGVKTEMPKQLNETVALEGTSTEGGKGEDAAREPHIPDSPLGTPGTETPLNRESGIEASDTPDSPDAGSEKPAGSAAGTGHITADVSLGAVGTGSETLLIDGLTYVLDQDTASAALIGWYGTTPKGSLSVPSQVHSGGKAYAVTSLGLREMPSQVASQDERVSDAGPSAKGVYFNASALESLHLPSTLTYLTPSFLAGCTNLTSVSITQGRDVYTSYDGMLFTKDSSELVYVPEGKTGIASLPATTTTVPEGVFSRSPHLTSIRIEDGAPAFTSEGGILYDKDASTLVACAPGFGSSVVIPASTHKIAPQAFAGCALQSVVVLGSIDSIDTTAFDATTKERATIVLSATEDYDVHKALWESAGFTHFKELASLPDTGEVPDTGNSTGTDSSPDDSTQAPGLTYTLLPDYTLSVSWKGGSVPDTLDIPASATLHDITYRVSTVAEGAFEDAPSLTTLSLPSSLVRIGASAFKGCSSLSTLTLPEGITSIGASAFEGTALGRVVLPQSLIEVEDRAFAGIPSLTHLVARATIPQVAPGVIAECSNVSILTPFEEDGDYPWTPGFLALGNHIEPYGIKASAEPLRLTKGDTTSLFAEGTLSVPTDTTLSYAYPATCISVDETGSVRGIAIGSAEVVATLSFEGIELARGVRSVEVAAQEQATADDSKPAPSPSSDMFTPVEPDAPTYTEALPLSGKVLAVGGKAIEPRDVGDTPFGGCTWKITNGVLDIRPTPGGSGVLDSINEDGNTPWMNEAGTITSVDIQPGVIAGSSVNYMFSGFWHVDTLDLSNLNTSNVINMESMFDNCWALTSITGLTNLDTINVTNMSFMFDNCGALTSITGLTNLDTSNVTSMGYMFRHCYKLTSLDLSSFNTAKVTSSVDMFAGTNKIATITIGSGYNLDLPISSGASAAGGTYTGKWVDSKGIVWESAYSATKPWNADTYTAQVNCTLTFDANGGAGGTIPSPQPVVSGTLVNNPGVPTHPNGYTFTGWYTESTCTNEWNFATDTMPASDLTLYAGWATIGGISGGCAWYMTGNELTIKPTNGDSGTLNPMTSTNSAPWYNQRSNIRSVSIRPGVIAGHSVSYMFTGCKMTSLDLSNLDTTNVTNMSYMLKNCYDLTSLDLSSLVTTSVTNMSYMFSACTDLIALDLSNFATTNVTNMSYMFENCYNLTSLNLSSLKTTNVTNMSYMFNGCNRLTTLDLSALDISNVTNMRYMFSYCYDLTSLNLSNLSAINVSDMSNMFNQCSSLVSLDLSSFSTSSVTNMAGMFSSCSSLTSLDLSNFVTTSVTNMNGMLYGCSSLISLDLSNFVTTSVTNMNGMFNGCSSLTSLDLSNFVTTSVTNMNSMFNDCSSLISLDLSNFVTTNVTSMNSMFRYCSSLTSLDLSNFVTTNVTDMSQMFYDCSVLRSLDVAHFDTAKVKWMSGMFSNCASLVSLDLSNFNTGSCSSSTLLFSGNTELTTVTTGVAYGLGLPPKSGISAAGIGFTGKWIAQSDNTVYEYDAIPKNTADTYEAQTGFVLTFNTQGGLKAPGYQIVIAGSTATMPVIEPVLNGSTFTGWYTSPDCAVKWDFTVDTMPGNDVILYAGWSANGGVQDGCIYTLIDGMLTIKPANGTRGIMDSITGTDSAPWFSDRAAIKTVVIEPGVIAGDSVAYMFNRCENLTAIDGLPNLDTSSVTNMDYLFNYCTSLTSLDLSGFTTSSVTSMEGMFNECSSIMSLNLSSFDTTRVLNMFNIFSQCNELTYLDLSSFVTQAETATNEMFLSVERLEVLKVGEACNIDFPYGYKNDAGGTYTGKWLAQGSGLLYDYQYDPLAPKPADTYLAQASRNFLSFDAQGGTGAPVRQAVDAGAVAVAPIEEPMYEGHIFTAWYKEPACTNQWDFSSDTMPGNALTLYAGWDDAFTVTFDGNGGAPATVVKTVKKGTVLGSSEVPIDPTRTGYMFSGWYTDTSYTKKWNFDTDVVQNNMTLYAQWIARLDITVPVDPKIAIDAQGEVTSGPAATSSFISRSVTPVQVSHIDCKPVADATVLIFPDSTQWPSIKVVLTDPGRPYDAESVRLDGTIRSLFKLPAASPDTPSELPIEFGLTFPPGVKIAYVDDPKGVPVATLSYTFQLVE